MNSSYAISAEVGQEFDMGRLFYYYYYDSKNNYQRKDFSTISSDMYASSNSKVATVDKNTGIVKVKNKGTTVITIKYKGISAECTLTADAKGAFGKTSVRKKVTSKAKAVMKAYNGKITSKKLTVNMDYLKLVKGRKYKLWGVDTWDGTAKYGWTKGKTFTAK